MTSLPVFSFDHDHGVPARSLVDLLGGKGAGLAEMTRALRLPVPPGFTIAVPLCQRYREGGWPDGLDDVLQERIAELNQKMGRTFGDEHDPLLLAVRSGAPRSMPGMLDTVLNLGLNDRTVLGLARSSGNEEFAWDSYRRFLHMFATTVMGVPAEALPALSSGDPRRHVAELKTAIERVAGRPVPADPTDQLKQAIEAVFRSWDNPRARAYRAAEGIDEDTGTAVNVQAMVFGNYGRDSGTGVVFTRNPNTGHAELYGDYLPCAQGEDVVAGRAKTLPISQLAEHLPDAYGELVRALRRLEVHYRDICDVEFTVERGKLWLLQTRVAKRGAVAAVRAAVQLVDDPEIALSPAEAVSRVPQSVRERARNEVLTSAGQAAGTDHPLLGTGLGASPGRVTGRVVLSSEAAAEAEGDIILVRPETSPEDVAGMAVATGILTTSGGLVSHAAVVARGWGIPAVVGAQGLTVTSDAILTSDGRRIREGDIITIDGSSGQVWLGAVTADSTHTRGPQDILAAELPELAVLERWASEETSSGETL